MTVVFSTDVHQSMLQPGQVENIGKPEFGPPPEFPSRDSLTPPPKWSFPHRPLPPPQVAATEFASSAQSSCSASSANCPISSAKVSDDALETTYCYPPGAGEGCFTGADLQTELNEWAQSNPSQPDFLLNKIKEADLIVANGGNPEMYAFGKWVDKALSTAGSSGAPADTGATAPTPDYGLGVMGTAIKDQVVNGETFFAGRSAGAMLGGGKMMTHEPLDWLREVEPEFTDWSGMDLFNSQPGNEESGTSLSVRPHSKMPDWNAAVKVFLKENNLKDEPLLFPCQVPNNMALVVNGDGDAAADSGLTKISAKGVPVTGCFNPGDFDASDLPKGGKGPAYWHMEQQRLERGKQAFEDERRNCAPGSTADGDGCPQAWKAAFRAATHD